MIGYEVSHEIVYEVSDFGRVAFDIRNESLIPTVVDDAIFPELPLETV